MLVHWYPFGKKKLPESHRLLLQENFTFYKRLSDLKKSQFDHRVFKFLEKYQFIGNDIEVNEERKTLLAGYYVMLTFGMRKYLVDNFQRIIIHPQVYYSSQTEDYHKGEYNRMLKAVVFSWEDFLKGHHNNQDNVNLALHEFTHVLHWNALKSNEMSAIVFYDEFREMFEIFKNETKMNAIREKSYFREYAYENQFEFLSVILEHFFETPQTFKTELPDLFERTRKMINFDEKLLYQN
ncbi:Mlc titration factor MtfA (ptsG expression regulator) [Flavobacterium arsenatis]|uniref:Mlc titration factor MtfA (PtsG expression regulator) n=1 Tax=Flavobacterium arsenatis TaxID=1484332 RepID=A0ABU1TJU7_9FLAO|nr:zinc-dependent peptidase [Flavobacterium arsenatis]MDR6966256.1 Mlc titration factor MtfA (ptsG expression regulator) [Flavobacterium arsenatis]